MLTVSLHGIKITATRGLYAQDQLLHNTFEVDVDLYFASGRPWPWADYTHIRQTVAKAFELPHPLLEDFVYDIHQTLRQQHPTSIRARVVVRKLHPPMPGQVDYAQVCYEE
jgi:dihydroneopterin aldolase